LRPDGRTTAQLRDVRITTDVQEFAEGSALIETGRTRVLCAVSVEDGTRPFLRGTGQGWVTAEYSMLPRSTHTRTAREVRGNRGRTQEIQRLIGRSLRAAVDLPRLGERTITVDCDVLQADGGTRTAAITGAYVALHRAVDGLLRGGKLGESPIRYAVASTSVGIVEGRPLLDLSYEEDSKAEVDFNIVMTGMGELVEIQGTAESGSFSRSALDEMLALAESGISSLLRTQEAVLSAG
jgi:ribonuclease PH